MLSWLVISVVIVAAVALVVRGLSGPWREIDLQDDPDAEHSDGWPGV